MMGLMVIGAIFVVVTTVILRKVYNVMPTPFIDEIFHIPQAQQYCNGSFTEWNDKITTPPGLYLSSLLAQLPLLLLSPKMFCSVITLRAVNVAFNTVNLFLIFRIMKELKQSRTAGRRDNDDHDGYLLMIQSVSLALFPVNYFFSFLYYTDPGSTMFVLAAYLACLKSWHKTSAMLGLISVFFRQTNIVWVLFCAGCVAAKEMHKAEDIRKIEASEEIKDKLLRFLVGILTAAIKYLLVISNLLQVLKLVWPYLCVLFLFASFIFINGSIVLGDKANHEASFHAPQILYFFAYSLFFSAPILVNLLGSFAGTVKKKPFRYLGFSITFVIIIVKYSNIHNFLLSDNRHYTFYLCRYVLKYPAGRLLITPVYVFAGWAMNKALLKHPTCTGIWRILFLICTCAVSIPQRLIEPRYFIVPYIIFRLNVHVEKYHQVILELLFTVFVNACTLLVFFNKEVKWNDIAETQRIIW